MSGRNQSGVTSGRVTLELGFFSGGRKLKVVGYPRFLKNPLGFQKNVGGSGKNLLVGFVNPVKKNVFFIKCVGQNI